jgi:S1-C subfamily serine protease
MCLLPVRKIRLFSLQLAIAISSLLTYQPARAQQPLQIPASELSIPGVAQKSSISAPALGSSAYTDLSNAESLTMQFKDAVPHTRGSQDIILFRDDAPSVVLIRTNDGLGSGSLLKDNVILTNFHVVDHNREVTIVFKSADPSGMPTRDEVVKADVIKIDVQRDLALVRPRSLPNRTLRPLQISSNDIEVGADVAAIGHPRELEWTFTKGIVSSVRPNFEMDNRAGCSTPRNGDSDANSDKSRQLGGPPSLRRRENCRSEFIHKKRR